MVPRLESLRAALSGRWRVLESREDVETAGVGVAVGSRNGERVGK
jgi:hypothetical protein